MFVLNTNVVADISDVGHKNVGPNQGICSQTS